MTGKFKKLTIIATTSALILAIVVAIKITHDEKKPLSNSKTGFYEKFLQSPCSPTNQATIFDNEQEVQQARAQKNWAKLIESSQKRLRGVCGLSNYNKSLWYLYAEGLIRSGEKALALELLNGLDKFQLMDWNELMCTRRENEVITQFLRSTDGAQTDLAKTFNSLTQPQVQSTETSLAIPESEVIPSFCSGEYCSLENWSLSQDRHPTSQPVLLYKEPKSKVVVGRVSRPGQKVKVQSSEGHIHPVAIRVLYPKDYQAYEDHELPAQTSSTPKCPEASNQFEVGSTVYRLQYQSEGFCVFSYNGTKISAESTGIQDQCPTPGPQCWGVFIDPKQSKESQHWWVELETEDGTHGWTDQVNEFNHNGQAHE